MYYYLYYTLHTFTFNDNVQITFLFFVSFFVFFIPLFFSFTLCCNKFLGQTKDFEVDKVAVVQPKDDKTSF